MLIAFNPTGWVVSRKCQVAFGKRQANAPLCNIWSASSVDVHVRRDGCVYTVHMYTQEGYSPVQCIMYSIQHPTLYSQLARRDCPRMQFSVHYYILYSKQLTCIVSQPSRRDGCWSVSWLGLCFAPQVTLRHDICQKKLRNRCFGSKNFTQKI